MLVDLSTLKDRKEIAKVLRYIKRYLIANDEILSGVKIKESGEEVAAITYYTNPFILFRRICNLMGVSMSEIRNSKTNELTKTIAYCIMFSFGHKTNVINPFFGLKSSTAGTQIYYRDKLRDMFITFPPSKDVYQSVVNLLEKDLEVMEDFNN